MTFTHGLATNNYGPAKFIVSASAALGTHTTIASALAVASSGDTIFIRNGTYTENLTLVAGVDLVAWTGDSLTPDITIIGNATFSSAGTVTIANIRLQTNSAALLTMAGSAATIVNLVNCFINCTNNTGISYTTANASSILTLNNCKGDIGTTGITLFTKSSTGSLRFQFSTFENSGATTTASTSSAGTVDCSWSSIKNPITTSGTSSFSSLHCQFDTTAQNTTPLTHGGSGASAISTASRFASGTASAVSIGTGATLELVEDEFESSNTNVLTGAGQINIGGCTFSGASSGINTTTVVYQTFIGGNYIGRANNTAPAAGFIGEELKSAVTAVSFSTGTNKDVTSLSLTAGIWNVSGLVTFVSSGTAISGAQLGLSTTSATFQGNTGDQISSTSTATNNIANLFLSVPNFRVTLSASTTYFLVGVVNFNAGTCTANGSIKALRVA